MASEVTDGTVDVRRDRDIAIITLRRERKCNALSTHMETELLRVLRTGEVTTSRAVVVTGGDIVFSAGADVTELREMTTRDIIDYYDGSGSVYEGFAGLPQPTVAAITGYWAAVWNSRSPPTSESRIPQLFSDFPIDRPRCRRGSRP